SQLLLVCQLLLPDVHHIAQYPSPLHRTMHVGSLLLLSQHFMVIAVVPAVIAGLAFFLSRTPYGIAIRAAAENADRAELAGISTNTGPGLADAFMLVLVLVLVLFRGSGAAKEEGGWSLAPTVSAIPNRLRQIWWVRRLNMLAAGAGLAVAIVLPLIFTTAARN